VRAGVRLVGWLFDDQSPEKRRRNPGGHAELLPAVEIRVLLRDRGIVLFGSDRLNESVAAHILVFGDERLLVRISVRDQLAVRSDDQGIPAPADSNLIDLLPHLLEADFSNEPSRPLIQPLEMNRERRRGQEILVETD